MEQRKEALRQVLSAIATTQWKMDFEQFMEVVDGDYDHWTQMKWEQFQDGARNLLQFDLETLFSIIGPEWPMEIKDAHHIRD